MLVALLSACFGWGGQRGEGPSSESAVCPDESRHGPGLAPQRQRERPWLREAVSSGELLTFLDAWIIIFIIIIIIITHHHRHCHDSFGAFFARFVAP